MKIWESRSPYKLRYWIAPVLFIFCGGNECNYAQAEDSVFDQYQRVADALLEISTVYELEGRWDDTISLLEHGIEIMKQGNFQKGKAQLQAFLGGIIWKRGHHQRALHILQEAEQISTSLNDKKTLGMALYNIGEIFYIKKFLMQEEVGTKALEYHKNALKARQEIDDQKGVTHSLSRLGVIYERMADNTKALEYYDKAIKISEDISYMHGMTRPLTHIGVYHRRQGDWEKALHYYEKALVINEKIGFKEGKVFAHGNVGQAKYNLENDFDTSMSHCLKALTFANELDFKLAIGRTLYLISNLYQANGNREKAIEYYGRTIDAVQKVGYKVFEELAQKQLREIE